MKATYLFQADKHYDVAYDTGDKAIQCGRHNDVFKLWLMWRANGDVGFESRIDRLMELSRHLQARLKQRAGFRFLMSDVCKSVAHCITVSCTFCAWGAPLLA